VIGGATRGLRKIFRREPYPTLSEAVMEVATSGEAIHI